MAQLLNALNGMAVVSATLQMAARDNSLQKL